MVVVVVGVVVGVCVGGGGECLLYFLGSVQKCEKCDSVFVCVCACERTSVFVGVFQFQNNTTRWLFWALVSACVNDFSHYQLGLGASKNKRLFLVYKHQISNLFCCVVHTASLHAPISVSWFLGSCEWVKKI